ncbi:MAG: hypothetical protein WCK47_14180 [bacterium]|nr:hypothetical protein [Candidatus Sumerlaeota bacterium]
MALHADAICRQLNTNKLQDGTVEDGLDRLEQQCERFGVGLITFIDPDSWDTFDVIIETRLNTPDPADTNDFIRIQLSESSRNRIQELVR